MIPTLIVKIMRWRHIYKWWARWTIPHWMEAHLSHSVAQVGTLMPPDLTPSLPQPSHLPFQPFSSLFGLSPPPSRPSPPLSRHLPHHLDLLFHSSDPHLPCLALPWVLHQRNHHHHFPPHHPLLLFLPHAMSLHHPACSPRPSTARAFTRSLMRKSLIISLHIRAMWSLSIRRLVMLQVLQSPISSMSTPIHSITLNSTFSICSEMGTVDVMRWFGWCCGVYWVNLSCARSSTQHVSLTRFLCNFPSCWYNV